MRVAHVRAESREGRVGGVVVDVWSTAQMKGNRSIDQHKVLGQIWKFPTKHCEKLLMPCKFCLANKCLFESSSGQRFQGFRVETLR